MAGGVLIALIAALGVAAAPAAAQTTVRVASSGIASDIGFFLALKKGYPRDEGLTVATLVDHTFIKEPAIHRSITPAAIDPDGRMNMDGLRNDLQFFKEQKLIQDPNIAVERIIDTSFVEKAVQELGPYRPRN